MKNGPWALPAIFATILLVSCGAPSTPDFVKKAAKGNFYQVEAGQLASEKGQSDAQQQVKALASATELFDRYAELGDNASLKQFAANTLAILKQHLERAKQLPQ